MSFLEIKDPMSSLKRKADFFFACETGDLEMVEKLIHRSLLTEYSSDYFGSCSVNPLEVAAYYGHLDVLKRLLEERLTAISPAYNIDVLLTFADQNQQFHVLQYLVEDCDPKVLYVTEFTPDSYIKPQNRCKEYLYALRSLQEQLGEDPRIVFGAELPEILPHQVALPAVKSRI